MARTTTLTLYFKSPPESPNLVKAEAPNGLTMFVGDKVQFQLAVTVDSGTGVKDTMYTTGGMWSNGTGKLESWMIADENGKPTKDAEIGQYGLVTVKKPGRYKVAAVWLTASDADPTKPDKAIGTKTFMFEAVAKPAKKLWLLVGGGALVVGLGLWYYVRKKSATKALTGW